MASLISSTLSTLSNHFKPHCTEAILRIRTNSLCLLLILLLTNLLPLPSLLAAFRIATTHTGSRPWSSHWIYEWFCVLEVAVTMIMAFNILEGAYAVKFPRAPLPPLPSPAKSKSIMSPPAPQRLFKTLSPNTSPQPQRSFAGASASFSLSTSASGYPTSPLSTPSRVLHYNVPPASSTNTNPNASLSSSIGHPPSPSPILSAYRGKHSGAVGRAFDGAFLTRLASEDSDSDD